MINKFRRLLIRLGKILPFVLCFIALISYFESMIAMLNKRFIQYDEYVLLDTSVSFAINKLIEYDWQTLLVLVVLNCLTYLANRVSETTQYESWSDEFSRKEIKEANQKFVDEIKKHIDWENLTEEDCKELRFGKWDEESGIYLIPLYLFPIIPIGLKVYSISGGEIVNDGTNLDNDTRFGCIAYGIKPKKC